LKKNANIVTEARVALLEKLKEEKKIKEDEKRITNDDITIKQPKSALSRFFQK
jgi:hypothetical protein